MAACFVEKLHFKLLDLILSAAGKNVDTFIEFLPSISAALNLNHVGNKRHISLLCRFGHCCPRGRISNRPKEFIHC
jgi:hypothetical protein